jgi:hypothetical protein
VPKLYQCGVLFSPQVQLFEGHASWGPDSDQDDPFQV